MSLGPVTLAAPYVGWRRAGNRGKDSGDAGTASRALAFLTAIRSGACDRLAGAARLRLIRWLVLGPGLAAQVGNAEEVWTAENTVIVGARSDGFR